MIEKHDLLQQVALKMFLFDGFYDSIVLFIYQLKRDRFLPSSTGEVEKNDATKF